MIIMAYRQRWRWCIIADQILGGLLAPRTDLNREPAPSHDRPARVRGLLQHAPAAPRLEPDCTVPPAARRRHQLGPPPCPPARPRRRRDSRIWPAGIDFRHSQGSPTSTTSPPDLPQGTRIVFPSPTGLVTVSRLMADRPAPGDQPSPQAFRRCRKCAALLTGWWRHQPRGCGQPRTRSALVWWAVTAVPRPSWSAGPG